MNHEISKELEVFIIENLGWISDLSTDPRFSVLSTLPKDIQIVKLTDANTIMLKDFCCDQQIKSHPSQNLWMIRECDSNEFPTGFQKLKLFPYEVKNSKKIGLRFIYSIVKNEIIGKMDEIKVTVIENLGWISDLQSDPRFVALSVSLPKHIQIIRVKPSDTQKLMRYAPDQLINFDVTMNMWIVGCPSEEIPKGEVILKYYEYDVKGRSKGGLKYNGKFKALENGENLTEKDIYDKIAKCHRDLAYYYSLLGKK